jgi:hypothetical protein
MRFKSRLKIGLGASVLGVIALVAGLVVPAATATASSIPKGVFDYVWKPGTPLPKLAAGEKLVAWPVYADGATPPSKDPPMVLIASANASGKVVETASAATIRKVTSTSAGTVNLVMVPEACALDKFVYLGEPMTAVGEDYSRTKSAQFVYAYSHGQGTALEVGISASGDVDSFSYDGTVAIGGGFTNSATQGFRPQNHIDYVRYYSEFRYGKFLWTCGSPKGGYDTFWQLASYEWAGGAGYNHHLKVPKYPQFNCVPEPQDNSLDLNYSSAYTFGGGFSLLGFTGSAHTGYDVDASMDANFPFGNGYLCGWRDAPGGSPRLLIAQLHY